MSGDCRSSRQFGGRRMLQSKIIWLADCSSAPQVHLGVSGMPQRYRYVPKRPTPFLSLFSATHRLRGSSESDGRQTAGLTKNCAGGVALSHAVLHDSRILKPELISAAAWRQKGRRECRRCVPRNCALWTRVWRRWLAFSCAWRASLKMECSLRSWAGGVPESKAPFGSVWGTQRWCAMWRLTQHLDFLTITFLVSATIRFGGRKCNMRKMCVVLKYFEG